MQMPFGKHVGKRLSDIPQSYLRWVLENCHNVTPALRRAIEAELASYKPEPTLPAVSLEHIVPDWYWQLAKEFHPDKQGGSHHGMKAVNRAKQLGNLPGNICTPTYLAKQAMTLGNRHATVSVYALSEKQMGRLGMGSLLSVAAGSAEEAKLIVMKHKGAKADSKPYVLVGKGITFDTGGISLKPGAAMDEMKFDMCGAASVIATMGCVAELKLPINVVGNNRIELAVRQVVGNVEIRLDVKAVPVRVD